MIYNRKMLAQALASNTDLTSLAGRCTGRTTAACLKAIAVAMVSPGKAIAVHDTGGVNDTTYARKAIADRGNALTKQLGLEDVKFMADYTQVTCTNNWTVEL